MARQYYHLLLERFPRSSYADDCYFFIAKSFMDSGDNDKALYNFKNILKIYSPSLRSEEAIAELERAIDMSFDFNKAVSRVEKTLEVLEKNKVPHTFYKDFDDIEDSMALYMLSTSKKDLFEKEGISVIYRRYKLKKLSEFSEPGVESMIYLPSPGLLMRSSSENFENYLNRITISKNNKFNADEVKIIFKYYLLREIIKDRHVGLILCWLSGFEDVSSYWREEEIWLRLMDRYLEPVIATQIRLEDKLNYPFNKNTWEQVMFYYMGVCLLREHNYNEAKLYLQRAEDNNQTYAALLLEDLN